ncbi:unnamed protein product [Parajaminaea phylloscopi]
MMESSKPNPPSPSPQSPQSQHAPYGAPRSSPFAYQQKLLARSASKSSGFGAASPTGATGSSAMPSPSAGLHHSGSIRRYPMPSSHRHTASLDPASNRFSSPTPASRTAPSPATPTHTDSPLGNGHARGSTNGSTDTTSSSASGSATSSSGHQQSQTTPTHPDRSAKTPFSTPSSRANRPFSMPPAPRDPAPRSPSRVSTSPFLRSASPTKGLYERPASPTKGSPTPGSPGKGDSAWITPDKNGAPGSFWASSSAGQSQPAAVHLGGVGDLKRSSVGALQMMRNYAQKTDSHHDDGTSTRMTVGRAKGSIDGMRQGLDPLSEKPNEDQKPSRPGRMESEDQAGEIFIPGITSGAEDVAGLHGRIRLARQDAAGAASVAIGATGSGASSALASLPFTANSKWMDTQRHLLQAYEYLCHCGEAKQWMEACVGESLGAVVDMENEMRDGVFLAKVARHFEPQLVPRIFTHPKLQYRHTDNVNHFFRFAHHVGLPVFFHFELTDIYEKKNFPKVVYCIHALSHILARQGRSIKVNNLVGKLEFTDDQLQQTQRGLDAAGVAMPSFGGLGKALAKEMNVEPEPEPESEQDRIERATEDVIATQAALRSVLAQRRLLAKIKALRGVSAEITAVQAQARGVLARRQRAQMSAALRQVEVVRSVGTLQSLARATIFRRQHQEQQKRLHYVTPDVTRLQAQIRGAMVRQEYDWWRNHLQESEPVAVHLQSLVRGLLARRKHQAKLRHYHEQMAKVVKIQSLFRAKQQGEQYRNLTMGKNVPVSTIKNFGHLLNDSDHDFEDEIEVERLRKLVVRSIRENQTLENDVTDLDGKIALLVKNKIGIEELIKAKNERGLLRAREAAAATLARRNSVLVAAGDPFADQTLDRSARRKLELYQELFYSLQTRPEYLARLFARVGRLDMPDRQRKQIEKIVLTLFGYAQKAREEYLLLKLFQRCISEELSMVSSVQEFIRGNAQFIKLVVQYNRGAKERQYLRDLLAPLVHGIIEDESLDLETDPSAIYRATINQEEMETGRASTRPLDVGFQDALADPMARTIFIRHLQALRATTEAFLSTIVGSTRRMPFGIRYIGREVFRALQSKFPQESEDRLIKVVAHLVYYRYLNPAVVAPETFDVIDRVIGPIQRKNLAEVSKMLTQISNGRLFSDDNPYLQPLNEYVQQASARFTQWLYNVIDVPDAEMQFNADEFLDHTIQQRPVIYISPHEIYSMHLLVAQQLDAIAPNDEDPLRATLSELGAPPGAASQELSDARLGEITFELVSRRTSLKDPEADTKALFVETKRLVLSLLKVQSGKTLMDVFLTPVSDQDELTWEEIVSLEAAGDRQRQQGIRPPMPGDAPRLEDVRRLSFAELKARTLENMLQLEQAGKVSRASGYQEMLNSIALDIRQKHRKRIQRHNEKTSMMVTLESLAQKKRYLEEQIASYHSYVDASMQTMQKKGSKKRFVLPFSQQYFHLRSLKQQGKVPKFGSYKYTATRLHEKGILLKIDDFGERQFEQLTLTISSDEAGVFTIDASLLGVKAASTDLRIEDLLEQQHNSMSNTQQISIGGATATLNLNLLIHLINRKFYA